MNGLLVTSQKSHLPIDQKLKLVGDKPRLSYESKYACMYL